MEKKKTASKAPTAKKPAKKAPVATEQVATAAAAELHSPHRKMLTGVVVSDKMAKTIVVKIERSVRHALYKKYVTKSCRFKAHDEKKDAKIGDLVKIVETRPMSRDKRWALHTILRRAGQAGAVQVMKDIGE